MSQDILLVDDEVQVRELLACYLEKNGFKVSTAATGRLALEAVQARTFDLMLLDIVLPDEDGLEMLKQLRSLYPNLPVIIMTGLGLEEELMRRARQNGASGFISKGGPLSDLLSEIQSSLPPA